MQFNQQKIPWSFMLDYKPLVLVEGVIVKQWSISGGAGETAQLLRALAALLRTWVTFPAPTRLFTFITPVPVDLLLSSGLCEHCMHLGNRHTCRQNTWTYKILNIERKRVTTPHNYVCVSVCVYTYTFSTILILISHFCIDATKILEKKKTFKKERHILTSSF